MSFPDRAGEVHTMFRVVLSFLLIATSALSSTAQAMTQEEIIRELVGAPVYSADGQEVGSVGGIALDADQQFDTLLLQTSRHLGFGERTMQVPGSAFVALRGAVILKLSAEGLEEFITQGAE
jgi:sporulation protein YlmC with PRC-barrel domain